MFPVTVTIIQPLTFMFNKALFSKMTLSRKQKWAAEIVGKSISMEAMLFKFRPTVNFMRM